jgi:hypothetical protein
MSLRAGALLLGGVWIFFAAEGCGGNADQFPIPEAGTGGEGRGDVDAGTNPDGDDPEPTPDADPEEDADPPPPSACPVFAPVRVSDAPRPSGQPAIHWNGTNYLVAWADERGGGSDIYAAWLTPEGRRVDGTSEIVVADTAQQATSPEIVALPGGGYLVVYENCDGVGTAICTIGSVESVVLGADGRPSGQPPVVISPMAADQRRPYVTAGHGNIYITFRDRVAAGGTRPAHTVARLARLDATGALVQPMLTFDETSDGHYPYVAVSPDRVALIYQRNKPTAEIVLVLLDPQLTVQREVVVRTGFDSDATNPVVQWNVQRWVLAWEDEREGEAAIYATVATADGSSVGTPQRAYDENGNWPSIASGGNMTSLIGFYGFPGRRVFLARMQADGTLKPGQVVIDDVASFPAVVYNDKADEYAVVYQSERLGEVMFVRFKCAD